MTTAYFKKEKHRIIRNDSSIVATHLCCNVQEDVG
jgi:hypothetical protein